MRNVGGNMCSITAGCCSMCSVCSICLSGCMLAALMQGIVGHYTVVVIEISHL